MANDDNSFYGTSHRTAPTRFYIKRETAIVLGRRPRISTTSTTPATAIALQNTTPAAPAMVVAAHHRPPRPSLNRHWDPLACISQSCYHTQLPRYQPIPLPPPDTSGGRFLSGCNPSPSLKVRLHYRIPSSQHSRSFPTPAIPCSSQRHTHPIWDTASPSPPIPVLLLALLANWLETTQSVSTIY